MAKPKPVQLQVGDRVRERERVMDDCVNRNSPSFTQVCQILRERRYGKVVGFKVKRNSTGSAINYIQVQWDHLNTPSLHAAGRIEKVPAPAGSIDSQETEAHAALADPAQSS